MTDDSRFAILIGSNAFAADSGLSNLRCPENDVEGVFELITSADTGLFQKENVSKLINLPHYEITRHLNIVCKRTKTEDVIFIYYSGHGKQDMTGRLYLATSDTRV